MRYIACTICLLLLVVIASGQKTQVLTYTTAIDKLVKMEMQKKHIPGLSLVVIRDGRIIKQGNYGLSNLELNVAVNPNTAFQIASMSKAFTCAGILLLMQDGKLHLDDKITTYFDSLPEAWKEITIGEMMSHTAGLVDDWNYGDDNYFLTRNSNREFLQDLVKYPLEFKPGEGFQYGCGPFVMGMLIEKISGKSYAAFMQERIFGPLGMTHTWVNDPLKIVPDRANGYVYRDSSWWNGVRISPAAEARGDVSVLTTASDMAKWDAACSGNQLLSDGSRQLMFSPAKLLNGAAVPYGFGWFVYPFNGHAFNNHDGGFRTGFTSTIDRYLDDHLTIIVLCNLHMAKTYQISTAIAALFNSDYRAASDLPVQKDPDPEKTKLIGQVIEQIRNGNMSDAVFLQQLHCPFVGLQDMRRYLKEMKSCTYINHIVFDKARKDAFNDDIKEVRFYKVSRNENKRDIYLSFSLTDKNKVVFMNIE